MKNKYLIVFLLAVTMHTNAQPNFYKMVNNEFQNSTVPLIAWGSKTINIFDIEDIDLPVGMFVDIANIELNAAIEAWNLPNHYTFTRNIGNDGNGNPYEGVVIQFITTETANFSVNNFIPFWS